MCTLQFRLCCVFVFLFITTACSQHAETTSETDPHQQRTVAQSTFSNMTTTVEAIFGESALQKEPQYYAFDVDASQEELVLITETLFDAKIANEGAYKTRQGELIKPPLLELEYPVDGVQLGQGWHINDNVKAHSQCIDFSVESAGGQHAELDYQQINSSDELSRSMNTSIQASGKGSYAGVSGKASYKSQISKKVNVEGSSQTHLLSATVIDGIEFVAPQSASVPKIIKLTDFAKSLLKEQGVDAFQAHCGQAYVSNIQRGAELYLIMQKANVQTAGSVSEEQSFAGEVSYLSFSAEASADNKSLATFLQSSGHSSFQYYHSAHSGLSIPSDIGDVARTVQMLGASNEKNPSFPFKIQLRRYSELPDYSSVLNELPTIMFERQQVYVNRLTSLVNTLDHMLNYSLLVKEDNKSYRPCKLSDSNCTQYDNLSLYYHPIVAIQGWTAAERAQFIELRALIKKDILNVNAHIDYCASLNKDNDECIAQYDGKYNDYFYRALLPIKKNQQSFTSQRLLNGADALKNKIANKTDSYNNDTVHSISKEACKKFLGLIKHHCKPETTNYTCAEKSNLPKCVKDAKAIDDLKAMQQQQNASNEVANLVQMRLFYLIQDTMKRRAKDGAIDYHLNEREYEFLALDMQCQHQFYAAQAQCAKHHSIWHMMKRTQEPLKFAYSIDFAQHQRTIDYHLGALLQDTKSQYEKVLEKQSLNEQGTLQTATRADELTQIKSFAELDALLEQNRAPIFGSVSQESENNKQNEPEPAHSETETLDAWLRMGVKLEQVLTEHKANINSLEHPIGMLNQIDSVNDVVFLQRYVTQLAEKSRLPSVNSDTSPTIITPNFALFSLEEDFVLEIKPY